MKTLKVTIVNRVLLEGLINEEGKGGKHSLTELNMFMKMLDKIVLTQEEKDAVNYRVVRTDADGKEVPARIEWNKVDKDGNDLDVPKEIELNDDEAKLLVGAIKGHDESKAFSMVEAGPIMEVAEQLGVIL